MKQRLQQLIPPKVWQLPVIILAGIFVGLGLYTVKISNAASYLSDEPETCINCHVMNPQYATWNHSSHRERATCNACHVPHTNPVAKYAFKAMDGARHATMFTLRMEPQVIFIKEAGKKVVQENCKRCHENVNHNVSTLDVTADNNKEGEGFMCWQCHREVPHGRVNSLSSVPDARVPKLTSPVPDWLQKIMQN